MGIEIVKLPPERWEEYKTLRLEAIKKEPLAFGASYSEEENKPEGYWKRIMRRLIYVVQVENQLVGCVTVSFGQSKKFKHIAKIRGLYVKSKFRGQGIAKRLLEEVIKETFSRPGVRKIKLTVNANQVAAVALYTSFGFKKVGEMAEEFQVDGKLYDAILMEKSIL